MNSPNHNNAEQKGANDKLHGDNLGETQNLRDLAFDKDKNSFEIDVKSEDKDYDHPLPYDTTAANGGDDNSDYDEANPFIGDEYARKDEVVENDLDSMGMHIDDGDIVELNPEDEYLAKTPEDDRTDLDEEGYPINNAPPMP
ncbi:hypothetical protein IWX76_002127 [Pedobacter sp. CAN_A7]|uniref:hypothetical protein n=1 Tax=Pedobacter sp. CAN_A7 TaxID=2787722 RepID=UPI0018CA9A6F